jgi:hypothetical protein
MRIGLRRRARSRLPEHGQVLNRGTAAKSLLINYIKRIELHRAKVEICEGLSLWLLPIFLFPLVRWIGCPVLFCCHFSLVVNSSNTRLIYTEVERVAVKMRFILRRQSKRRRWECIIKGLVEQHLPETGLFLADIMCLEHDYLWAGALKRFMLKSLFQ